MRGMGDNSAAFGEALVEESPVLPDDHKKLFHYVQWNLGDYITGTQGMTPDQEGVYMRFLVRLYDRGKAFVNDDRVMAMIMSLDIRKWRRLKDDLIAIGKIIVVNGCLTNSRFERERKKRAEDLQKQAESTRRYWESKKRAQASSEELRAKVGEKSERSRREVSPKFDEKPNEINANGKHPTSQSRVQSLDNKKEECPNGHLSSGQLPLVPSDAPMTASRAAKEAFALYNETAKRCGLPTARILDKDRARNLALRVKDAGGMDGFKQALANIEKSAFLQGKTNHGFRADLNFVCQRSSFIRLFEGGYGNGAHAPASPYPQRKKTKEEMTVDELRDHYERGGV